MQVWIGTSGYSYADWVGTFYPAGTRPQRMLAYYTGHFPLVELNFTFYRLPTPAQLGRIAQQAPATFQFLVKLPRTLSHEHHVADIAPFRDAVSELRRRHQLQGVLCQLPQSQHHGQDALAWLDKLANQLQDCSLAVEFRHRSWQRQDVGPWLRDRNVDLVSVDVPDLPGLYPRGLVPSGSRIYVRFHSRNAANWYQSDKERYDYDYTDKELTEWIDALRHVNEPAGQAMLLFNNCHRGQAVVNAQRLRDLLTRAGTELHLVSPFVQQPVQRSLFD
ncbi:MAG: DUF72 domain-containing protein [Gemmataceae bacterium]|nr:DUF72 domain-containing protein [Gemmataceae bacterium]